MEELKELAELLVWAGIAAPFAASLLMGLIYAFAASRS